MAKHSSRILLAATAVTAVGAGFALSPALKPAPAPAPVLAAGSVVTTDEEPEEESLGYETELIIGTGKAFPGTYAISSKRSTCRVKHTLGPKQSREFTIKANQSKIYILATEKQKLQMSRCSYTTVATDRLSGDGEPRDGVNLVGTDVAPGTYVFEANPRCYATVAEKASFNSTFTSIVYGAAKVVQVQAGNVIKASECTWRPATSKEAAEHVRTMETREAAAKAAAEAIKNAQAAKESGQTPAGTSTPATSTQPAATPTQTKRPTPSQSAGD